MTEMNLLKLRKQKETQRLREQIYDCWRDSEGVWDGRVHTAILKMGNEQGSTV